ncbi:MAG: ribosome maturation factor RimM [Balneolales bacterium]
MRADNNFIFIGKIVKAHGTKGEVVIALGQPDLAGPELETLFVKNFAGDLLPYKVEEAVLREKSSRYSFFVKFARIDSRTESEEVVGSEVYKFDDAVVMPEKETGPASLIGCDVFDEQGTAIGKVVDEMHTQAHPLVEIDYGAGSLMLPYVDEYIVDYRPEDKRVIVKNLDRFIE